MENNYKNTDKIIDALLMQGMSGKLFENSNKVLVEGFIDTNIEVSFKKARELKPFNRIGKLPENEQQCLFTLCEKALGYCYRKIPCYIGDDYSFTVLSEDIKRREDYLIENIKNVLLKFTLDDNDKDTLETILCLITSDEEYALPLLWHEEELHEIASSFIDEKIIDMFENNDPSLSDKVNNIIDSYCAKKNLFNRVSFIKCTKCENEFIKHMDDPFICPKCKSNDLKMI